MSLSADTAYRRSLFMEKIDTDERPTIRGSGNDDEREAVNNKSGKCVRATRVRVRAAITWVAAETR